MDCNFIELTLQIPMVLDISIGNSKFGNDLNCEGDSHHSATLNKAYN